MRPDYHKIFTDMIEEACPGKLSDYTDILGKESLSVQDVITLNARINRTADRAIHTANQKHKAYSISDIREILNYGQKHKLNNTQLAAHFKMSRNTVGKWKKMMR